MFFGKPYTATPNISVLMIAAMWNPHRQPMLSDNTPPRVSPKEKPIGWPPPMEANAIFLLFPSGNVLVMILTAEGRQKEIAMPARPRNRMSCEPFCERPQAIVNKDCNTHPVRYIVRLPITSATAPSRRSVQPHVKAYIEAGLLRDVSGEPIATTSVVNAIGNNTKVTDWRQVPNLSLWWEVRPQPNQQANC